MRHMCCKIATVLTQLNTAPSYIVPVLPTAGPQQLSSAYLAKFLTVIHYCELWALCYMLDLYTCSLYMSTTLSALLPHTPNPYC